MTTEVTLQSNQRKKQRLVRIMGGKCYCCGYNKCLKALEFHHLDPNNKDFSISENAYIAFDKAAEEVKKCVLVCANCHREIHAGLIQLPKEVNCFNEEEKKRVDQELYNLKHKKLFYCKDCGKIISSGAMRCPECAKKNSRKVEHPSREKLKELIRNTPFSQIGLIFDVSDNAVRKWCDKYNLPRTKKEINSYSNQEWVNI